MQAQGPALLDLIDDPRPGENAPELTVSEISGAIKKVLEGEFGRVRIRGEVGRVFPARSGHLYFDLKDDRSVLAAVSWKGQVASLTVKPEEGMEVVATGRLTTFGSQSKYQLNVDDIRPAGVGALMAMLEKRKKALEAEGLFAAERKKPLPYLPGVIGVVTSPSGAVIRDILHRLRDRFPRKVLVWPVAVQGDRCAPDVARAIAGFNALTPGGALPRPDLLIVARGGGSIEDLWGFNEEIVARATAASEIPLISAVGHETDTTLIDYVSDVRAPTPTAAAELAVPVRSELLTWSEEMGARLSRALTGGLDQRRQRSGDLARALPRPEHLLAPARQRLDATERALPLLLRDVTRDRAARLSTLSASLRPANLTRGISERRERLTGWEDRHRGALSRMVAEKSRGFAPLGARLDPSRLTRNLSEDQSRFDVLLQRLATTAQSQLTRAGDRLEALDRTRLTLGYEATLARGYSVIWNGDRLVAAKDDLADATTLEIQFRDGREKVVRGGKSPKPRGGESDPPEQGTLF